MKKISKIFGKNGNKKLKILVSILAAIIVFTTTYSLILPAITIDNETAQEEPGIEIMAEEAESAEQITEAETEVAVAEVAEAVEESAVEAEPVEEVFEEETVSIIEETVVDETADQTEGGNVSGTSETESQNVSEATAAKEEETTAAEVKMPAVTFEEETNKDLADENLPNIVVKVVAEEGTFPEGTTMKVKYITNDSTVEAAVKDAVDKDLRVEGEVKTIHALDISFFNKDGKEIEPLKEIKVTFKSDSIKDIEDPVLVHIPDEGKGEAKVVDQLSEAEAAKEGKTDSEIIFKADEFSKYVIVETGTIETTLLTADGRTLTVTVNYDEKAGIPEGAELEVKEIQEGDEGWLERSIRLAGALSEEYGNVTISDARFLSISIIADGKEFEPLSPVGIKIEYTDQLNTECAVDYSVDSDGNPIEIPDLDNRFAIIHYTEDGYEVLDTETDKNDGVITESLCITDSFSDYDAVYVYDYDAPEAGNYGGIPESLNVNPLKASDVPIRVPAASGLLGAAGSVPAHEKGLTDNNDGTYTIDLSVTGDADTSAKASPVNVLIVYDISTSMTWNRAAYNLGGYGLDESTATQYTPGDFFQLYNAKHQEISDGYVGDVYRRTVRQGNYSYTLYTGQRYYSEVRRADAGEKVVYDFVNSLFEYQDEENPGNIQVAFETFSDGANRIVNWTSTKTDITNRLSSTGAYNSHKLTYGTYTNWEAAMKTALTIVNSADQDPTYVVFVTDGAPTKYGNNTASNSSLRCYQEAIDDARNVELACEAKTGGTGALYGIYAYGNEADYLSALIYYANNGVRPASSMEGETFETPGYYNASEQSKLEAAIADIFQKIVSTMGIKQVSIEDGTTSNVVTSTGEIADLLEVDEDTFQYWLSWPVESNGDGTYSFTMPNKASGGDTTYRVEISDDGENVDIIWPGGSTTYPGSVTGNTLKVEWTRETAFYTFAPPAAVFNDPTVDWDLTSLDTLLDGVTYQVTFECYPSQYTMDLVADLKNGLEYDTLDENVKKYLLKDGDDYVIATNTTATLHYTDTRTDKGPQTSDYDNPEPQKTEAANAISVSKDWENIVDKQEKPESLTMHITRDGEERYELVMHDDNGWKAAAWISYGIITVRKGKITVKTTGHDYSFSEPEGMDYYWELDVPTLRPMLINAKETMLLKIDESEAPAMSGANATATSGGVTYYKLTINGEAEYYRVDSSIAALTATNSRRSYLEVLKKVDENNAPADAKFPFTMSVTNSHADTGTEDDVMTDYYVWFSVYDRNTSSLVTDPSIVNADGLGYELSDNTVVWEVPSEGFNGYYVVPSGNDITVNMKANYNLRFLNLPAGSTYSIVESEDVSDESFALESITGNRHYKDEDGSQKDEAAGDIEGTGVSGTIEHANSIYTMTFDNKYTTIDIQLKKVKEDGKTILGGSTFKLTKASNGVYVQVSDELDNIKPGSTSDTNPADLGGLGCGEYRLEETDTPTGYIKVIEHVDFEIFKDTDLILKAKLADGTDSSQATLTTDADGNYVITVVNIPGTELPKTGGSGTLPYTLGGIALLACAALMYGFRMRRRERRLNE